MTDEPKRQRGRPREVPDGVKVNVLLPGRHFDRLTSIAHNRREQSLSRVLRKILAKALDAPSQ